MPDAGGSFPGDHRGVRLRFVYIWKANKQEYGGDRLILLKECVSWLPSTQKGRP